MKLSAWARRQGVHYNTALRWVTNYEMPVAFERTATGTILVKEFVGESGNSLDLVALYARVSGSGQKLGTRLMRSGAGDGCGFASLNTSDLIPSGR
jgi:putative resolvase